MRLQLQMLRNGFSHPYANGSERLIERLEDRCLLSTAVVLSAASRQSRRAGPQLLCWSGINGKRD